MIVENTIQILSVLTLWSGSTVIGSSGVLTISPSFRETEAKKSLYYFNNMRRRSGAGDKTAQSPGDDRIFIPPYKFPFWGLPYGVYSNGGFFNPGLFPFVPGGPGFPPYDGVFGGPKGPGVFPGSGPNPFGSGPPPPTSPGAPGGSGGSSPGGPGAPAPGPVPTPPPPKKKPKPKYKKPRHVPYEDDCDCSYDSEGQDSMYYPEECSCDKPVREKYVPKTRPRYNRKPAPPPPEPMPDCSYSGYKASKCKPSKPKLPRKESPKRSCKYGYNSGSRGGCKPPPPTPAPEEHEDEEPDYTPKCRPGYSGRRGCRSSYKAPVYEEEEEYEPEVTTPAPPQYTTPAPTPPPPQYTTTPPTPPTYSPYPGVPSQYTPIMFAYSPIPNPQPAPVQYSPTQAPYQNVGPTSYEMGGSGPLLLQYSLDNGGVPTPILIPYTAQQMEQTILNLFKSIGSSQAAPSQSQSYQQPQAPQPQQPSQPQPQIIMQYPQPQTQSQQVSPPQSQSQPQIIMHYPQPQAPQYQLSIPAQQNNQPQLMVYPEPNPQAHAPTPTQPQAPQYQLLMSPQQYTNPQPQILVYPESQAQSQPPAPQLSMTPQLQLTQYLQPQPQVPSYQLTHQLPMMASYPPVDNSQSQQVPLQQAPISTDPRSKIPMESHKSNLASNSVERTPTMEPSKSPGSEMQVAQSINVMRQLKEKDLPFEIIYEPPEGTQFIYKPKLRYRYPVSESQFKSNPIFDTSKDTSINVKADPGESKEETQEVTLLQQKDIMSILDHYLSSGNGSNSRSVDTQPATATSFNSKEKAEDKPKKEDNLVRNHRHAEEDDGDLDVPEITRVFSVSQSVSES